MGLSPTPCDGRFVTFNGYSYCRLVAPGEPANAAAATALAKTATRTTPSSLPEDASSTAAYKPPRLSNHAPTPTGSQPSSCLSCAYLTVVEEDEPEEVVVLPDRTKREFEANDG